MLRSPPFNTQANCMGEERERERESAVPPAVVLRKFLQVSARRGANRHGDYWSVTGTWEGTPYCGECYLLSTALVFP